MVERRCDSQFGVFGARLATLSLKCLPAHEFLVRLVTNLPNTQIGYDCTQNGFEDSALAGTLWQLRKLSVTIGHRGENKSRKFEFRIHKKKACRELQTFILGAFLLGMITNQLLYQLSYTGLELECRVPVRTMRTATDRTA